MKRAEKVRCLLCFSSFLGVAFERKGAIKGDFGVYFHFLLGFFEKVMYKWVDM